MNNECREIQTNYCPQQFYYIEKMNAVSCRENWEQTPMHRNTHGGGGKTEIGLQRLSVVVIEGSP